MPITFERFDSLAPGMMGPAGEQASEYNFLLRISFHSLIGTLVMLRIINALLNAIIKDQGIDYLILTNNGLLGLKLLCFSRIFIIIDICQLKYEDVVMIKDCNIDYLF